MTFDPYPVANGVPMADGDLNGDGSIDTVYVSISSSGSKVSTITSALSSKTGTAPAIVAGGQLSCTANSVLLADLNKDGKLDAVVTCAEGIVAVMQGNGDGSFQSASTYTVASAAKAVAADLNGDGSSDVLIATATANGTSTFAVLLNQGGAGTIQLGSPTIYGGAYGSTQLMTGDLNGDGKLDVIAGGNPASVPGSPAGIFYGNGDGTLKPASFGGYSNIVTVGDFNGDGVMDTAAVSSLLTSGQLTSVIITPGGVSSPNTNVTLLMGIVGLHALDVNGDGHTDLVVTGSTTTVLLGDGSGNLTVGRSYATPGNYYGSRTTGSGKINLLFTTPRGFYTLKGNGDGTFNGMLALFPVDSAAAADVNGDGLTDLAVISQNYGFTYSAVGRGDGAFLRLNGTASQFNGGFPVLADLDGDGIADLLQIGNYTYSQSGQSTMIWSKGSGDGNFTGNSAYALGISGAVSAVTGDFDGDGKTDVIVSYADPAILKSGLLLVHGNGNWTFTAASGQLATTATLVSAKVLAADLNGDKKLDLVWGNTAYINQGGGNFSPIPFSTQGTVLAVGDLDGDGIPDLVLLDNTIHHGNGDGSFQTAPLFTISTPSGSSNISAAVGDLNGDGHPDVVMQYMADMAGLSVALSDGRGGFISDSNVYTTGDKTPISGALARLNNQAPSLSNDNRLDYVAFVDGAAISILNQTNPAPIPPPLLPTTLMLTTSLTSPVPTQMITLTSSLTGVNPTGAITFTTADGKVIGRVSIIAAGAASVQVSFANLGTYTVTATYTGDGVNAPSTSPPVTITVAKYSSSTQIQILPAPYYVGRSVDIRALVTGYNVSGLVTFTQGNTTIGTAPLQNGSTDFVADLPYVFASAGSYTITASFPGDNFDQPSTSPGTTVTVVPGPDFTMTVTPASYSAKVGDIVNYTLTLTPTNGYSGYVTLTCQGCTPLNVPVGYVPSSVQFSVTAPAPQNSGPHIFIYGALHAALLIMFGWKRRWRRMGRQLNLSILAVLLAIGLGGMSGCSSGNGSGSSANNPPTTYNIVITGTDDSIQTTHTVTLQLVVTP